MTDERTILRVSRKKRLTRRQEERVDQLINRLFTEEVIRPSCIDHNYYEDCTGQQRDIEINLWLTEADRASVASEFRCHGFVVSETERCPFCGSEMTEAEVEGGREICFDCHRLHQRSGRDVAEGQ
jgi:hypothetical protein